ncbi:16S rRNA (cytosine(967)-C(5))-methyltransferase RsmB [Heyndrickxia sp. NPDC080065]|uniref:16S rRNA (cytosine(967)-C(5))-methyltransferase RsmB n=1 Tax=Heyndrickxia sp. NPDC080065 TaxID=3390568 RepID=UPI003D062FBB
MVNKNKNVREAALEILEAVEKNQAYSNLLLNHVIKRNHLIGPDIGLLTEITYGTLQRKITLDYYLKSFINKKIETWVQILLRLSLYQMVYLDKIPDRAIIYEAVEIAKKRGHRGISGMVNGILRAVQREGLPSLEKIQDPIERVAIETSHPAWMVKRWSEQYGLEKTKTMCETNLLAPLQTARVNTTKAPPEVVKEMLEEEGFEIQLSPIVPEAIRSLKGNLAHSKAFTDGFITIQDESSMLVTYALNIEENQFVLDACAAPGGKSTHIAEKLHGTGKVISLDLHEHKTKLIQQNAIRLGLTNIETKAMDSRKVAQHFEKELFDRVLVDAPCSGLGVLRKKPDIKYSKSVQDIHNLQIIQKNILHEAARLVKPGGLLVYSTCTVDKEENEETVNEFLRSSLDFEVFPLQLTDHIQPFVDKYRVQIFPQDFGGDGFFIACFRKKESWNK